MNISLFSYDKMMHIFGRTLGDDKLDHTLSLYFTPRKITLVKEENEVDLCNRSRDLLQS